MGLRGDSREECQEAVVKGLLRGTAAVTPNGTLQVCALCLSHPGTRANATSVCRLRADCRGPQAHHTVQDGPVPT